MKKSAVGYLILILVVGALGFGLISAIHRGILCSSQSSSFANLSILRPLLFDGSSGEVVQKIDFEKLRKLPAYDGDINGVPKVMIDPVCGKPYIYRPYAGKLNLKKFEWKIILYSPESVPGINRAVLVIGTNNWAVFDLTEEQFQKAETNDFVYYFWRAIDE